MFNGFFRKWKIDRNLKFLPRSLFEWSNRVVNLSLSNCFSIKSLQLISPPAQFCMNFCIMASLPYVPVTILISNSYLFCIQNNDCDWMILNHSKLTVQEDYRPQVSAFSFLHNCNQQDDGNSALARKSMSQSLFVVKGRTGL